jgi:ketosteroid isomerase-like protein
MTTTETLLATNQAFYGAFERKDLETIGLIWSKNPNTTCIHPGRMALRGWDQIRVSWDQIFRSSRQIEVAAELVSVEVQGNIGFVVLVENLLQVIPDRRMEVQGMVTNIFEHDGNQWSLMHRHTSPLMR